MEENRIDHFNNIAKKLFKILVDEYGYILDEIKINDLNGMKWSTHHIYINSLKNLKIEIKQEPYYTDYGFSFFIYKMGTDEYNILCNIAHEKQDKEGNFLLKAYKDLFSTEETLEIISGKHWKKLKYIPFN